MFFCTKCGAQIDDTTAVYCEKCGSMLEKPAQTTYASPPPYLPPEVYVPPKKRTNPGVIIAVCAVVVVSLIIAGVAVVSFPLNAADSDDPGLGSGQISDPAINDALSDEERFDLLIDDIFAQWVSEDTITMQFFLADPEAMGIERPEPTYGRVFSPEMYIEEKEETARLQSSLESIRYENLSTDRQIIYDILCRNLDLSEILEEKEDYSYYTGYIKPVTGIQVQLPVLLAEFKFYTADDIELYLAVLEDTIRYFDDIIEFERERAARGFFLSDGNLDTVIEQLETFTQSREDCFLIAVVDDKIDQFPGLSTQQRDDFKQRHRELVLSNVLVAYDNLLEAMISLKGVGSHSGGLAGLPDGERVAHANVSLGAGTDRSSAELETLISQWREQTLFNARIILAVDTELMEKYMDNKLGSGLRDGTPEEYLNILKNAMTGDFPVIDATNYTVYEVHESLSEFISPAFFLTPAIDRYDDNVIYINPAKIGGDAGNNMTLFTMLAHEGYPGHLYESIYSRQQSQHPMRTVLSNNGYTEGWATYAEYTSYHYAGLDTMEAELLKELNLYFLLLQAHADIGVNLLNWGIDEVAELLNTDLGIDDMETVQAYYDSVTGMPLNTSMYALGYIELMLMRDEYEAVAGNSFDIKEYHRYVLDFGPAPFSLIREHMR